MENKIKALTPSRLCLFGEHQDYLGLEVIAVAINLNFSAKISKRDDNLIRINIRDERLDILNIKNEADLYQKFEIDITRPIKYKNNHDFISSTVNTLLKAGYPLQGFDISMDSQIPIGKGMCSSTTMIIVLIKAILEGISHPDAKNAEIIAKLGFKAEVEEFGNPGGMMDHFASALGGLVHLDFSNGIKVSRLNRNLTGKFILFDSLARKKTIEVLADSKYPTLEGLKLLKPFGVNSIKDFVLGGFDISLLDKLDDFRRKKVLTNIENYRLLKQGLDLLQGDNFSDEKLGSLIYQHHMQLRDGLEISTPAIEKILNTAMENGALGGKINGSGGGGCCYAYVKSEDCQKIIEKVTSLGYPSKILEQDTGVRVIENSD